MGNSTPERPVNNNQSYLDKAVKLVPTEIVGAYLVLVGVVGGNAATTAAPADQLTKILVVVIFFVLLVATPLYQIFISKVTNKVQIIVTTIAFALWVYNLGGPFSILGIYEAKIAAALLTFWSFLVPLIVPASTPSTT
jgi:hypothetical protein